MMKRKKIDTVGTVRKRDPDFVNADIALRRAAQKARERARNAGIGIMVMKDGKIFEEKSE